MRKIRFAAVLAGVAALLTSAFTTSAAAQADPSLPDEFVRVGTIGTNAVYKIVNRHSGKCLEILGWSTKSGAPAGQWKCLSQNNQRWEFIKIYEEYKLKNVHSGLCLASSDTTNGAVAYQTDCVYLPGARYTYWTLTGTSAKKEWRFRSTATNRCLEMIGWSTADGAKAGTWSCIRNQFNQLWY